MYLRKRLSHYKHRTSADIGINQHGCQLNITLQQYTDNQDQLFIRRGAVHNRRGEDPTA